MSVIENSWTFWKHFWNIWNFVLLLLKMIQPFFHSRFSFDLFSFDFIEKTWLGKTWLVFLAIKICNWLMNSFIIPLNHINSLFCPTLFILIFARTNFRAFAQKNPFARKNYYRIYAEKGYARNLIRAKIISFHLIHFEPFQKLYFDLKGIFTYSLDLRKTHYK